jgi:hypothetical protein
MIVSLLKNNPQERPSTHHILNHPYIRKLRHDRDKKVRFQVMFEGSGIRDQRSGTRDLLLLIDFLFCSHGLILVRCILTAPGPPLAESFEYVPQYQLFHCIWMFNYCFYLPNVGALVDWFGIFGFGATAVPNPFFLTCHLRVSLDRWWQKTDNTTNTS